MAELRPDAVAMEEAFFGENVQSTLALGEARGVAMFVAAEHGLTVTGYPPATVKQAVVGHGRATKQQIGYLVRALLALRRTPEPDAADALAIAICHARRRGRGAAASERRRDDRVPARRLVGERRRRPSSSTSAGVGYQVLPSAPRRRRRCPARAPAQLHIHTHFVTDEPLRLYGFVDHVGAAAVPDAARRAGGRAARRAGDPGRHGDRRAGARDRDRRRRAPDAGQGGRGARSPSGWRSSCARRS